MHSDIESWLLNLFLDWNVGWWYSEWAIVLLDNHSLWEELVQHVSCLLHHVLLSLSIHQLSLQILDLLSALIYLSLLSQCFYLVLFNLSSGSSPLASNLEHIGPDAFAHYNTNQSINKYGLHRQLHLQLTDVDYIKALAISGSISILRFLSTASFEFLSLIRSFTHFENCSPRSE